MVDREKVVKGLNYCRQETNSCAPCPYLGKRGSLDCIDQLMTDALELLTPQGLSGITKDDAMRITPPRIPPKFGY